MKISMDTNISYHVGNYVLIDSKALTVFSEKVLLYIDSFVFEIYFREIKGVDFSMSIEREIEGKCSIYINNFNKMGLQGFLDPMSLGTIDGDEYHFTLSGLAVGGSKYKAVTMNILRKII